MHDFATVRQTFIKGSINLEVLDYFLVVCVLVFHFLKFSLLLLHMSALEIELKTSRSLNKQNTSIPPYVFTSLQ